MRNAVCITCGCGCVYVHVHTDEDAVKALKELRLTANDFEAKGIIGRGHFGEVSHLLV